MHVEKDEFIVGDKRFACTEVVRTEVHSNPRYAEYDDGEDHTFYTRRCLLKFESGVSISFVWGSATYSANRDAGGLSGGQFNEFPETVEAWPSWEEDPYECNEQMVLDLIQQGNERKPNATHNE